MKKYKIFYGMVAFGKIESIVEKIMFIYNENDYFIIHYNKREPYNKYLELKKIFFKYKNIEVVRWNKVYWGRHSILKTYIMFMKKFLNSQYDYIICLDNKTIPININSFLKKYSDNTYFLNLERNNMCAIDIEYRNLYDKKNEEDHYCNQVFKWKNAYENYNSSYIYKKIYILKLIFYNLLFNKKFIVNFIKNDYKKNIIRPKTLGKYEKFCIHLFPLYTYSGNFIFNKKQIYTMLNDDFFWKIYNFSKNKPCAEEWVIQNYFYNKYKDNMMNINDHISILYFKKDHNIKSLSNINLNQYLFIRYCDSNIHDVLKYLLSNKKVDLSNLNL